MRLRSLQALLLAAAVAAVASCAEIPKESVELSVTIGRDLAEVHRANRELAIRYFGRIKRDIETFVNDTYRPYVIRELLQRDKLLDRIKPAASPAASDQAVKDAFDELDVFVSVVAEEIEDYRQTLLKPIAAQEAEVLKAIDDAHQNLQSANAIVTGHLMSIRKVRDAQAELLDRAGMGRLRERFVDTTVSLSDKIGDLLQKARKGEEKMDEIAPKIGNAVADIKKLMGN